MNISEFLQLPIMLLLVNFRDIIVTNGEGGGQFSRADLVKISSSPIKIFAKQIANCSAWQIAFAE